MRFVLLLLFCAAVFVPFGVNAGYDRLDAFHWLEGSWTRDTSRGVSVETWSRVSETTMEGFVTLRQGEALMVTEHLRLERLGDNIFYVAKPRENAFPTAFRLVEHDDRHLVFQNPTHDFPQQITYTRPTEQSLVVEIARIENEGEGIAFEFERVIPENQTSPSLAQFDWMAGTWAGVGFGGNVDEIWTRPRGGSMLGMFRLVTPAGLKLSEHMMIHDTEEGPELRLKHFHSDLTGWEEKAEYVSFPLKRSAPGLADFGGVKYERTTTGLRITVHIAKDSGTSTTVLNVRPARLAEPGD